MSELLRWVTTDKYGIMIFLFLAALLEAGGDFSWNQCIQGSKGWWLGIMGSIILIGYGIILNSVKLKFGELIGIYIVFFFVVAQCLAFRETRQLPSVPVVVGGSLIVAGGFVIHFWRA